MKSFSILNGKAHVVELPESDNPFRNLGVSIKSELDNKVSGKLHSRGKNGWESVNLPPGTWQIIGMLPEVTEEVAAELVDSYSIPKLPDFMRYDNQKYTDSAIESLESAIVAERYYLDKNPVPPFNERLNDWIEAQSRVLCRERTLILKRI